MWFCWGGWGKGTSQYEFMRIVGCSYIIRSCIVVPCSGKWLKQGARKGMPLYYGWFILHFPLSGQVSVVSSTQAWGRSIHKTDSDDIVPNYWYLSVPDVAVWLLRWNGRFLRSLALDWPPFPIMENGSCLSNFDIKIPWSGINKEEFNSSYDTCIMPGVLYTRLMCKDFCAG